MIRAFGVGYAPVGPAVLMDHLRGLGYSTEELVWSGLCTVSPRGRAHAHFRSRIMFPVRDRDGVVLGFAGLGTHLGPSWALWVTSPDIGLYHRSDAIFGLDRAAKKIASSRKASVLPDCIEVLRAHQEGRTNAVTVHSNSFTREQSAELASGVPGGVDAVEIDLPSGIELESARESRESESADDGDHARSRERVPVADPPSHLNSKRILIVAATALAAINTWTGAPLFAVWVGSQVQSGRLLSMWGVATVVAVLAVLAFLLLWALTWLNAKYDELTGRPTLAGQTSPWHRAMRGDRVQDVRARYGISAPERAVAISVVAAVLVFEVWFFFLSGSSLPGT